jgi:hypothetical protein
MLQELDVYCTALNKAHPWRQGARENTAMSICSNCRRDVFNPVPGDKATQMAFMVMGRYLVDNMLRAPCYQFAWRNPGEVRPPAHEGRRLFHVQNTKPEHCEDCNRDTTQNGHPLTLFAVFCDPTWKWLC